MGCSLKGIRSIGAGGINVIFITGIYVCFRDQSLTVANEVLNTLPRRILCSYRIRPQNHSAFHDIFYLKCVLYTKWI